MTVPSADVMVTVAPGTGVPLARVTVPVTLPLGVGVSPMSCPVRMSPR